METATFRTGNLVVRTRFNADDTFSARIYIAGESGCVASVDCMRLARGWSKAIDSRDAHREMASSALSFEGAGLWSPDGDCEAYERPSKVEDAGGWYDSDDSGEVIFAR